MLVYGDGECEAAPATMIAEIAAALDAAAQAGGILRHEHLVEALIEAGMLAQGLADEAFRARGEADGADPAADAALAATCTIARIVARSWTSGFRECGEIDAISALSVLSALPLPELIRVRLPEGFAHYCVYPEAYMEAAHTLPADGPVSVVGIRSIGTTLAAMVAESVAELSGVTTLRPFGHPFDRVIAANPGLRRELIRRSRNRFAIVDEGPGLSGSSIAAVAGLLAATGVPEERVHVLPSHGGEPGPRAGPETRRVWSRARRHFVAFDDLVLRAPQSPHRLESWCVDLLGELIEPLVEISGGVWRRLRWAREAHWPPVHPWQERRKFLLITEAGSFLVKFAGLGRVGRTKLDLARALFTAGFVPEPVGLRHGFLIERRIDRPAPIETYARGARLIDRIGDYLGFRARTFPARQAGASAETLFAMLRYNAGEVCGPDLVARLDRWRTRLADLERRRRPALTDNRLHAWEWLLAGDVLLKSDAVDHHAGHDLVGPQDIAWDIAGATVELDLSDIEQTALMARTEQAGVRVDRELVQFMTPCYLAFQLGYYTLAQEGVAEGGELVRLATVARRYRDRLSECLQAN